MRIWVVSQLWELPSLDGQHGVICFLHQRLRNFNFLLDLPDSFLNLSIFGFYLFFLCQDETSNFFTGSFLLLQNRHNRLQFLSFFFNLRLHIFNLLLQSLKSLWYLINLQNTSIQNILFFLGLVNNQFIVLNKFLDEIEVIERIVLEMILVILKVDLHQIGQVVVYFQ